MALENYIFKKEVDWSVLTAGFTFPLNNQVVFGQIANRFLQRGERKTVRLFLDGVSYMIIPFLGDLVKFHPTGKEKGRQADSAYLSLFILTMLFCPYFQTLLKDPTERPY